MASPPANMAKASRGGATPPCSCLPEEIAIWEILVRLPPKSLLSCRAVCRAWRRATSTREFLLAHHGHQPSLPIVAGKLVPGSKYGRVEDILVFDHRAADAQLQPLARLDATFIVESSCDGLLVLSKRAAFVTSLSVCNPVTRQNAPLVDFYCFSLLAMYLHRPTGEYRLLLHRICRWASFAGSVLPKGKIGCYIFALGSDQPPRYIQGQDSSAGLRAIIHPRVRDCLHWFPVRHPSETRLILVFDTTTESFRHMRPPAVPSDSDIFEMDDTLGIYSYNSDTQVFDMWVLQNYEREVWIYKYNVKLPVAEIKGQFGGGVDHLYRSIGSVDGEVLFLLTHRGSMFYVNTDGELVDSFRRDGQQIYGWDLRLKQTLVPHNFFTALQGHDANTSPFL